MIHNNKVFTLMIIIASLLIINQISFAEEIHSKITKFNCSAAPIVQINSTAFNGTWFAVARKSFIGEKGTQACIKLNLNITAASANQKNATVKATITYASNNLKGIMKNTTMAYFNMSDNVLRPSSTPGLNLKIVGINYTSYAFVCAYPNLPANAAAFILTREKSVNSTELENLEKLAALNFTDFQGMQPIDQNCTKSDSTSIARTSWIFLLLISLCCMLMI